MVLQWTEPHALDTPDIYLWCKIAIHPKPSSWGFGEIGPSIDREGHVFAEMHAGCLSQPRGRPPPMKGRAM